jgi:hypothetical protein
VKALPTEYGGAARIISGLSDRVSVSRRLRRRRDGAIVHASRTGCKRGLRSADRALDRHCLKVVLVLVAGVAEMVTRCSRARRAVEHASDRSGASSLLAWAVLDTPPLAALRRRVCCRCRAGAGPRLIALAR